MTRESVNDDKDEDAVVAGVEDFVEFDKFVAVLGVVVNDLFSDDDMPRSIVNDDGAGATTIRLVGTAHDGFSIRLVLLPFDKSGHTHS